MSVLKTGLYDRLVDVALSRELELIPTELKSLAELAPDVAHEHLARALHIRIFQALKSIKGDDRVARQVAVTNDLLRILAAEPGFGAKKCDLIPSAPMHLHAVLEAPIPPAMPRSIARPRIPLSVSDLLVNAPKDVSLGPELKLEIDSADGVDLLCSFVKWSGLRIVEDPLKRLLERCPGSLRVLTTTYMGATERRALDRLIELGADVRVSYDRGRTRLHAKAWMMRRESGFSTAFIGSSNLSAAAILDGLEWNVRLSEIDNHSILNKFRAAFEQYWADPEFRPYDPEEFARCLKEHQREKVAHLISVDLQPRPHQEQILAELAAERAYGHLRNLVVAATGTGKTVVAALDYRRVRRRLKAEGKEARLLFVAHRRELLKQSRATFQVALRDGAFGELLGDGHEPSEWRHVFANVQSLTPDRLAKIPADAFEMVVVDEFHHAAAATYARLLEHLKPELLLGLTATPERADGKSILGWFDGRIASETRLWTALDQSLLCPFQYFGIGAGPDLRGVKWTRGRYDIGKLSNVYTADHMFALRIIQETDHRVRDVSSMRALGFCVDLKHAAFMTERFNEAGIVAIMVSGASSSAVRDSALRALKAGDIQIIFTVDLFNEGIDLPEVDTIIFLRPTESATIFLQQLGRGLRRAEGKECCTVLDFIGQANRKFRFDARYRAIVGGTRRQVERQIKDGFPRLPSGCFMHLDAQAQIAVLANVRAALGAGRRGLIEDLQALAGQREEIGLRRFMDETETELEDIYSGGCCWTALRRRAGLHEREATQAERTIERALGRMLHVGDDRLEHFEALLGQRRPPKASPEDPYQRLLFVMTGHITRSYDAMDEVWNDLWRHGWLRDELLELLSALKDRRRTLPLPLAGRLAELPLRVHGTYSRDEVFAAFDERTNKGGVKRTQGGIHNAKRWRTELLFVELEKSDGDYTPTTRYDDYPVTPTLFHWESQASCHEGTPSGQRYLDATPGSEQEILLFVRQRRKDALGNTSPYLLLGLCDLEAHRAARPMQIDWRLRVPMPTWFFMETKAAGG